MAKYSKKYASQDKSGEEAMAIARGTQKPGQTKEQTRLIAQGIQKGVALYKKQHAAKMRELDKRTKKTAVSVPDKDSTADVAAECVHGTGNKLPWILLVLSWICFGIYFFLD